MVSLNPWHSVIFMSVYFRAAVLRILVARCQPALARTIVFHRDMRPNLAAKCVSRLGIDRTRLTYQHQGLDFRLSGVEPAHM